MIFDSLGWLSLAYIPNNVKDRMNVSPFPDGVVQPRYLPFSNLGRRIARS